MLQSYTEQWECTQWFENAFITMCSMFNRDNVALHHPGVLNLLVLKACCIEASDLNSISVLLTRWAWLRSIIVITRSEYCSTVLGLDQMKTKLCCGGQLHRWVFWIFFHVPLHWWFPTACQWSTASLQDSHSPKCQWFSHRHVHSCTHSHLCSTRGRCFTDLVPF